MCLLIQSDLSPYKRGNLDTQRNNRNAGTQRENQVRMHHEGNNLQAKERASEETKTSVLEF